MVGLMDSWEDRVVVVKLRIFFGVKDIIFCYSNHSVARGVVIGVWNGQGNQTWEKVVTSLHVRSLVRGQPWNKTEEWSLSEQCW